MGSTVRGDVFYDGTMPIVALLLFWVLFQVFETIRVTYRRRHRSLTSRAPAGASVRQSQRPTPTQGPAMPSDDEVTHIGRPDYGPPLIDPTQGFPMPGKPRRTDHRGLLIAGAVALVVAVIIGAVAVEIHFLGPRSTGKPQAAVAATSSAPIRLDSYARLACQKLDKAVQERESGDQFGELNALIDEQSGRSAAIQSSLGEVAAIAKQELPDSGNYQAVTATLRAWCSAHWSPGQ
jgi:hypothetical protein